MAEGGHAVARRAEGADGHAAIRRRVVEIFFQKYPGMRAESGIRGLDYQITIDGGPTRNGTTGNDGKIRLRMAPGTVATLRILGSEYRISLSGPLHPVAEMRGVQQRLNMLGLYAGPLHGDNRRADTFHNPNEATERAILDFQADNDLFPDAMCGRGSLRTLNRLIRDNGGE